MEYSSKLSALLLLCMIFISTATPILGCGYCGKPAYKHHPKPGTGGGSPHKGTGGKGPIIEPPIKLPPVVKPPVTLPPVTLPPAVKPPITLPPVTLPPVKPPIELPPFTLPPVKPPIDLPPVTLPPVKPPIDLPPVLPPILNPPKTPSGKPCPPPPSTTTPATCPIDILKLGACVDLLGGLVHIGLGDPVVNKCCPVLAGLVELEAAACLCTALKVKLLNLNIFVPLALQLFVTCGKTPPPGFTCSL